MKFRGTSTWRSENTRLKGIYGNDVVLHVWGDSKARKEPQIKSWRWWYHHYKYLHFSKKIGEVPILLKHRLIHRWFSALNVGGTISQKIPHLCLNFQIMNYQNVAEIKVFSFFDGFLGFCLHPGFVLPQKYISGLYVVSKGMILL